VSLVLILCEERFRERLTGLVSGAGFGLVADEAASQDLAAALPGLLASGPSLK
jgi:hypothetical protein